MTANFHQSRNFLPALIGDGRPLISLTGVALLIAGGFAIFLSATGAFLPQDVDYLGMQVRDLCSIGNCRTVHFMFHDRVSFGGVLIAIGTLYLWLAEFPLKAGKAWAWWTLFLSGVTGFSSFLAYLGYGYLDTWHGAATMCLLPIFVIGMERSFGLLHGNRKAACLWRDRRAIGLKTKSELGWLCVSFIGLGMVGAGAVIMFVGMTTVFVPEDLMFLQATAQEIAAINPHLVPLIAHDRAGFGGGLLSAGIMVALIALHAEPAPAVWQALLVSGAAGFLCAVGVHLCIGYLVPIHLAPAIAGAAIFIAGMLLIWRDCNSPEI